jgi:hypothetical protein
MRKHLFDKENNGGYHEGDPLPSIGNNHYTYYDKGASALGDKDKAAANRFRALTV